MIEPSGLSAAELAALSSLAAGAALHPDAVAALRRKGVAQTAHGGDVVLTALGEQLLLAKRASQLLRARSPRRRQLAR